MGQVDCSDYFEVVGLAKQCVDSMLKTILRPLAQGITRLRNVILLKLQQLVECARSIKEHDTSPSTCLN